MTVEVTGNYFLQLAFGETKVQTAPADIQDISIYQYLNKFVPALSLKLVDSQGMLQHFSPFDKNMSRMSVLIAESFISEDSNSFDYLIWRRNNSSLSTATGIYEANGLLNVKKLFFPGFTRSFNQPIIKTLTDIAISELEVDGVEISSTLQNVKQIIQPGWSNAQLFSYLEENLEGQNGEFGYKIFIKNKNSRRVFVCKTYEELINGPVQFKFTVNDTLVKDMIPIFDFDIIDNYRVWGFEQRQYSFFDYDNSKVVNNKVNVSECPSLTFYHLMEREDGVDSLGLNINGRSNDFTKDFSGKAKSRFQEGIMNLVQMWILTWGLPNIVPGDIIDLTFALGANQTNPNNYQYSGFWLVSKVVHSIKDTHRTRLFLIRNGLNTDLDTSLIPANNRKI